MSKWMYKTKSAWLKEHEAELAQKFQVNPVILKVLEDRGVKGEDNIREYLEADIKKVSDGSELTDMKKGVQIIANAVKSKKRIRIMGDYDVDGVTSTYVLYCGLKHLGAHCDKFLPHRIEDGYGLHEDAIRKAYEDNVEVILTCDNGIAAAKEILLAKELGMTVVVTDHHEVPYEEGNDRSRHYILPPADAVIDPKRQEDTGVFKEICGAVVAWKFMLNLYREFNMEDDFHNSDFLEIVSLGTVCDVMDLLKDNRAIVKEGLKHMKNTSNIGLQALIEELGLKDKDLKSYDYGFKIGPCINAEGRLDSANEAFDLLTETDREKAKEKASAMRALNEERQRLTKEGMEKAFQIIDETMSDDKVLVIYLPETHESIAGIIAGKVRERYNKPAFVLTKSDKGFLKGSGRSIPAYSMFEKMNEVKDMMLGFGGHPLAAGLSVEPEKLDALRSALNEKSGLTEDDFIQKVMIDIILPIDFLTQKLIKQLEILEPFGKGNEKPIFAQSNVRATKAEIIGANKNVLKITFANKNCKNGVCFSNIESMLEILQQPGKLYDFKMLYYPGLNEWKDTVSLQAVVMEVC